LAFGRRGTKWHTLAGAAPSHNEKDRQLAKPNYEFQKRQKELAKKQKKEEKKLRKTLANEAPAGEEPPPAPADEKSPG
jgi:uncharacterized protein involved in exopolysaccharide biosynthesis